MNTKSNILIACYYYILNKVSYLGIFKYDKHNTLKVTINESRINTLLRFGRKHEEKLYNYSLFLNKIIIHNLDKNRTKQHYQNIFDEKDHIGLKNFLDELYNRNYNLIKSNNFTGFIF